MHNLNGRKLRFEVVVLPFPTTTSVCSSMRGSQAALHVLVGSACTFYAWWVRVGLTVFKSAELHLHPNADLSRRPWRTLCLERSFGFLALTCRCLLTKQVRICHTVSGSESRSMYVRDKVCCLAFSPSQHSIDECCMWDLCI